MTVFVHPSAEVAADASLGEGTRVWHQAQVREGARLGRDCVLGKGAYVDVGVVLGDGVKVQNGASLYRGTQVEDGVFVGPRACVINDRHPRALTPDGRAKGAGDWQVVESRLCRGASLGAGAIVLPGVTVGPFAMVAAGAVVAHDVVPHGLVMGVPARLVGFACACGCTLEAPLSSRGPGDGSSVSCRCGNRYVVEEGPAGPRCRAG